MLAGECADSSGEASKVSPRAGQREREDQVRRVLQGVNTATKIGSENNGLQGYILLVRISGETLCSGCLGGMA